MSIDSTWLRCPNCFRDLAAIDDRVYGCAAGHRFDRAKHGYLTLLSPRAPRTIGDDREMLAARAALLDGGAYAPIADALIEAARSMPRPRAPASMRIADLACGTGYYSGALARSAARCTRCSSPTAPPMPCASSLRSIPDGHGRRARPLAPAADPRRRGRRRAQRVRTAQPGRVRTRARARWAAHRRWCRATAISRNSVETARCSTCPPARRSRWRSSSHPIGLDLTASTTIEYALRDRSPMRRLLVGMGPSARHATTVTANGTEPEQPIDVTISVDILVFGHTTAPTG